MSRGKRPVVSYSIAIDIVVQLITNSVSICVCGYRGPVERVREAILLNSVVVAVTVIIPIGVVPDSIRVRVIPFGRVVIIEILEVSVTIAIDIVVLYVADSI